MEPDMGNDREKRQKNVQDLFDQVLYRHIQRLTGASCGPGDLPADSTTLSLLILLMDRKNETDHLPSGESEHYSPETLITELEEMGFDSGKDLNGVIEDMAHKDYILVDNGRLFPNTPAINLVRLLDQAFPKMPGMNFVAYVVQTMDEVKSNRKDLDSALNQFDQMLQMQGVSLKKESKSPKVLRHQNHSTASDHSRAASSKPKVLSSDAYKGKVSIRKVDFGTSSPKESGTERNASDANERIKPEKTEFQPQEEKKEPHEIAGPESFDFTSDTSSGKQTETDVEAQYPADNTVSMETPTKDSTSSSQISRYEPESIEKDDDSLERNETEHSKAGSIEDKTSGNEEATDNEPDPDSTDDDIEKRITAFEEDLAMECPMCRRSKVKAVKTRMGKSYYKCQAKRCNFISWGKPYHILCPQCKNPFLIESSDSTGKTILKCPRATCRYWQAFPMDPANSRKAELKSTVQENQKQTAVSRKPRRRVVKRRVVRRKK